MHMYVQRNVNFYDYNNLLGYHECEGQDTDINLPRPHASNLVKLPTHFFSPMCCENIPMATPLQLILPYFSVQYSSHTISNQIWHKYRTGYIPAEGWGGFPQVAEIHYKKKDWIYWAGERLAVQQLPVRHKSRVASEISRNEISQNVSRNFYFAFREIFEWLSRNFAKFCETKCLKISRKWSYKTVQKRILSPFYSLILIESEFKFNIS